MADYALPILHAVFVWWFSTGVILYLDGLPTRTFKWSMLGATAIFGVALYGLYTNAGDATVSGAYAAFTYGLLAWGWQEISFYMGYVTGPRARPCGADCRGWRHFWHALETSLYHEISIVVTLAVIVALTWGEPNQVGLWTFVTLWWMHESARLNVFLGVRNVNEEFLPDHMEFLKSFLNNSRPINLLFPVSVTISTIVTVLVAQAALAPAATAFEVVGYTFVATMMALAILEHWFLVLPLPGAALWNWSLRSRTPQAPAVDVEIVAGFLGAGKTTVLRRRLAAAGPDLRCVALAHDCAALAPPGVPVTQTASGARVERPDGQLCLGLRDDLAHQLKEVIASERPDRIVIEPNGIADISVLMRVLNRADIKPSIKAVRLTVVIDAGAFMADYARLPEFLKAQVQTHGRAEDPKADAPPPVFIINKADQVAAADLATVTHTLRALNPSARIVTAIHGVPEGAAAPPASERAAAARDGATPGEPPAPGAVGAPGVVGAAGSVHHTHHHHHHHHHYHGPVPAGAATGGGPQPGTRAADGGGEVIVLDLRAWSADLTGRLDPEGLRAVLDDVARGTYGEVDRLRGVARSGDGWMRFEVADGRTSLTDGGPADAAEARVVAVGRALDGVGLRQAFEGCAALTQPA
ncbi:putative photosynthetic complex assembly protein PuhE [Roseospira goensis]|uniref:Putative photosynthetic complex assembly protein 2 n=1 Tax=Roseospira goensis TaxID=391922 RepID=A0A7W6RXG5_9PROT|nr:putative photosynthetic complex assembly protein PuhE [Roseospira goensis]MBB4284382.1 putative photosynthetic complex assembly protein 2 [Roseospira goensis]